jgi:hypothetical protein
MPAFIHYAAANSLIVAALTLILIPVILAFRAVGKNADIPLRIGRWVARNYRVAILSLAAVLILALGLSVWALRAFPNSGDEYVYLFQADTLLAGRLWNPVDPLHKFFSFFHIFEKDGKWVGQYTPGWPLILAAGKFAAVPPYAVSPICAVALLLAAARLYETVGGPLAAAGGAVLLAFNAFFILNGASYFPHIATALFGTLFVLYGLRYLDKPTISSSVMVGATLGAVGIMRPYSAILFAAPFGVEWLLRRRYQLRTVPWIAIAGLPFFAGLLANNWAITGDPLVFVQHWGNPLERLGLHPRDALGDEFSLLDTSATALRRLEELAMWTSPMLLLLYLFAACEKIRSRTLRFYDFAFPMFVVGYILYPQVFLDDNRYGPRYYFEAYPILVLTIVSAVIPYLRSKPDKIGANVAGVALAAAVFSCLMFPIHLYENHRVVDERMVLYDLARDEKLTHAVVVLRSGTGIVARMAPLDLTRNGINVRDANVIYALSRSYSGWLLQTGQEADDSDLNLAELFAAFPDRDFYAFEEYGGQPTLRKLAH